MSMTRTVIGFSEAEYQRVIDKYVCAQCYGDLSISFAPNRKWYVFCPYHGNVEIVGRITKSWAEYIGQQWANEYLELRDKFDFILPAGEQRANRERQSPETIIYELGYGG